MKKLEALSVSRLNTLEFGQHIKSIIDSITGNQSLNALLDDQVIRKCLQDLSEKIEIYNQATMKITKSDETEKISEADKARDRAISSLFRYHNVFEFSTKPEELVIYKSLHTLFTKYKGITSWNYEQQSSGVDSMLAELHSSKYIGPVTSLRMEEYVERLKSTNDAYKAAFMMRIQERSNKEVYDLKGLREELKNIYEKMLHYTVAMATAVESEQYTRCLTIINTVRKYYADMLSKRNANHKPGTNIPRSEVTDF